MREKVEWVLKKQATFKEAANWASGYINKRVSPTNIAYLIQYGRLKKRFDTANQPVVNLEELKEYYDRLYATNRKKWEEKIGGDINWNLSFQNLREKDTTKHVHRLHPYKGKFIPQLVEYFLDQNLNHFKKRVYFMSGDTVLDPFVGCGTTLVQSCELGINSVGIDLSEFNCLISKAKVEEYNIDELKDSLSKAFLDTKNFSDAKFSKEIKEDKQLTGKISQFNKKHFPNSEYKFRVNNIEINEKEYAENKMKVFFKENGLILNGIKNNQLTLSKNDSWGFLDLWLPHRIKQEANEYIKIIDKANDEKIKQIMKIVLSRTIRSCRSTTHSNLATLRKPQYKPYYCTKHFKICSPVDSMIKHLKKNTFDALKRLEEFNKLRKSAFAVVINGDSRNVDVLKEIKKRNIDFYNLLTKRKIDGIFTSPPYLGQIDYHEQHAYAYEMFNINRKDDLEIGPLSKGKGKKAQEEYILGISNALSNCLKFLKKDANIFIVANDKFNLYPTIARKSKLRIVDEFKRPVLNRTEKDKQPYAETIFRMKPEPNLSF